MITLLLFVGGLAQCGGKKSRSFEASSWKVLPEEPIVFLGKTKDGNGNDVEGPWFKFRLAMSNADGADSITVIGIELEITGVDDFGTPVTTPISLSPSDFDFSYSVNDVETACAFQTFGTFPVGAEEEILTLTNGDASCTRTPVFVLGGLTKKSVGSTYRFKVKARPMGWFGDYDDPKDRFDMNFSFSTR